MSIQRKVVRNLEQLSLYKWTKGRYVKNFLNEYHYLISISGNTFNQDLGNKLFHKLSGPLGLEIIDKWNNLTSVIEEPDKKWSIGQRIQHVIKCLEDKCVELQIQKQLKKTDYKFCKDIFTPQTYGASSSGKKTYNKKDRKYKRPQPRKRYFLKKSNKRKPYLDEKRHVRKFKPDRTYKNKFSCYVCNNNEHLPKICPKRINNYDKKSTLVECTNEDLIQLDEYISD